MSTVATGRHPSPAYAGTGRLIRLALRRDRVQVPVWLVAFAGVYAISVVSLKDLYPTANDLHLIAVSSAVSPVVLATNGLVSGDSLGAVVNIGLGSPTGVEMGTGAKFPAKYQQALFINDWTYGKIYAVHMTPEGASYTGTFEPFITGRPLPVTDIVVHSDGAMYFTIGGRRTQSGLYRVTYTGRDSTASAQNSSRAA